MTSFSQKSMCHLYESISLTMCWKYVWRKVKVLTTLSIVRSFESAWELLQRKGQSDIMLWQDVGRLESTQVGQRLSLTWAGFKVGSTSLLAVEKKQRTGWFRSWSAVFEHAVEARVQTENRCIDCTWCSNLIDVLVDVCCAQTWLEIGL